MEAQGSVLDPYGPSKPSAPASLVFPLVLLCFEAKFSRLFAARANMQNMLQRAMSLHTRYMDSILHARLGSHEHVPSFPDVLHMWLISFQALM